jgi:hypothetical protein
MKTLIKKEKLSLVLQVSFLGYQVLYIAHTPLHDLASLWAQGRACAVCG